MGTAGLTHTESTQARQLARAISDWSTDLETLAQETPREVIEAAIAGYEQSLIPMSKIERAERADTEQKLAKLIQAIGVRISPTLPQDNARAWTVAMVDAMRNYPARYALIAAKEVSTTPMQFPSEVLGHLQKQADRQIRIIETRIRRLKRMMSIHDRPPLLEATAEAKAEAQRISDEDLQAMPEHLRQLGLTAGFLIECENGRIRWASDEEQDAHRASQTRRHSRARERF